MEGSSVEQNGLVMEECIIDKEEKQHSFLVMFHEKYVIQGSLLQAVNAGEPFAALLPEIK